MSKKQLIAVVGPTAIGKTNCGIQLAQHFNTEILSADSRQFYKEMAIGTAVPSQEELAVVKHHFIQHKSIHENYSVGDFEQEAIAQLTQLFKKHDTLVLVGGSGLYVDAVVKGLDDFPKVDKEIRENLTNQLITKGLPHLQNQLKDLDPVYYNQVDLDNPHRVIRALEICIGSGKPYSSFLNQPKPERFFTTKYVGITADRAIIYNRINKRVDIMMEQGLLDEAKALLPFKHLNALQTVGYRELFSYFDGTFTLDEATEEIKKNTRRFAKRQLTWYRKNESILWVDYQTNIQTILNKLTEHD